MLERLIAWLRGDEAGGGSSTRIRLGARGERIAERHLKRNGYRIVSRNFRAAGAEVDLVAMDGATLVFVEVKTRQGASAGAPQEAVDRRKQAHIRRAAAIYADRNRAASGAIRFDVVAIAGAGAERRVEILKDAF
ncbi:MAG: YraN family protein [Candidatus Binataceae bacterium]|jgi:putative endonuclease